MVAQGRGLADYRVATSYAWNPEELLNVYLPQFSGMLDNYWGRNGIHLHSDYVGVVVLVLAGAAFIGSARQTRAESTSYSGRLRSSFRCCGLWEARRHSTASRTRSFRAPSTFGRLLRSSSSARSRSHFLQVPEPSVFSSDGFRASI